MRNAVDELTSIPADSYQIAAIASRFEPLIRKLGAYSFPSVAGAIAGLMTRPENHAATTRLEAMIHLAALGCRGDSAPSTGRLREWINVAIYNDVITGMEDPVEDVAVSNLITPSGNVRLLTGNWFDITYAVQDLLAALTRLSAYPWAASTMKQLVSLLRLSESIADRAALARNTLASDPPKQPLYIAASVVESGRTCVTFEEDDLQVIDVALDDLEPFILADGDRRSLLAEHLKHSSFQRRPLIRVGDQVIVALPTSIGVAIVRYAIECAHRADAIGALERALTEQQVGDIWTLAVGAWGIKGIVPPSRPTAPPVFIDSVGQFDSDSPVHLVYVPDSLTSVGSDGLHSHRTIGRDVIERMEFTWTELSARAAYRSGLTIVVHGGVGRGFSSDFLEAPSGWHILALPVADFMLLAWDEELSALRTWKILDQEYQLAKRGNMIQNLSGFPNLYAFLRNEQFMILPYDCDLRVGMLALPTDLVASLRHSLRNRVDSHGVMSPTESGWLQVQRMTTQPSPLGDNPPPIYISPGHAATSRWAACVKSSRHVWWMTCDALPDAVRHRNLVHLMWQMALRCLASVTSLLQERLPDESRRCIWYSLRFPDIASFSPREESSDDRGCPPIVTCYEGRITIECSLRYLRAYSINSNMGERMMVAALLRGAYLWAGSPMPSATDLEAEAKAVVGGDKARFFDMTPSRTPEEDIYAAVPLPKPRFPSPEDRAWTAIGLAQLAGRHGPSGLLPNASAEPLMARAVNAMWQRIRKRLLRLDRRSVLQRSLLNAASIQKDRLEWQKFSTAMLAMSDDEQNVRRGTDVREADRALSALASRVIAEMALCTSPTDEGKPCTERDIDTLLADVATLLACAVQKDAMHYGLLSRGVMVHPNGSFGFDPSIQEVVYPFVATLRGRQFWDVERGGPPVPESVLNDTSGPTTFKSAFVAEFGLSIEQFGLLIGDVAQRLIRNGTPYEWIAKAETIRMLKSVGAQDPAFSFAALVLRPRAKWDEQNPGGGCERRDWFPWRYGRRLSVLRRPLVQLSTTRDSDVLLMPTLLESAASYLLEARTGRLPERLFDSSAMRSWVGAVTNHLGHVFNQTVATKLRELKWSARAEVEMTELGGDAELGDVDVLAWRKGTGPVYAIECKRLMYDRTVGEIGRRLRDYTDSDRNGQRTPIQKTLDRLAFLKDNRDMLSEITGMSVTKTMIRSALVTDDITPMHFSQHVKGTLDLVVNYQGLEAVFGTSDS